MTSLSCDRPGAPGRSPYRFSNFATQTMILDAIGTQINSVFPQLRRVTTLDLQADAGVILFSLSTSLINAQALDTVGVFLGLDRGDIVNLNGSFDVFLSHLTRTNSIPGLPVASSRCNALNFGIDSAYKLASGAKLALYACSANLADNEMSAVASVYWTPASGL